MFLVRVYVSLVPELKHVSFHFFLFWHELLTYLFYFIEFDVMCNHMPRFRVLLSRSKNVPVSLYVVCTLCRFLC